MTQAAYTFHEFIDFAEKYQEENGKPPTADAIVAHLGGSKPTAIRHRQRWLSERAEPAIEIPMELSFAITVAIRSAEARRDAMHRERAAISEADLVSLGEAVDELTERLAQASADLTARTTERDQLSERAANLADERARLLADLDAAKHGAARADALLHERTGERDRLAGQVEELRVQLAAVASERDRAHGQAAALAALASPDAGEQRAAPARHKHSQASAQQV
jgi:hypothetical protein